MVLAELDISEPVEFDVVAADISEDDLVGVEEGKSLRYLESYEI